MTTTNDTQDQGTLNRETRIRAVAEAIGLLNELPGGIASVQHLAVPRMFAAGGVTFFLSREGALSLDERDSGRPLVKLTPREAFAVLTFMRIPGVAALIEQANAADQQRMWRDYEASEAAERAAGR